MSEPKMGKVTFEVNDRIGTITLSRPGKRNSLTQKMFDELVLQLERFFNAFVPLARSTC